jgi:hypothetical protein
MTNYSMKHWSVEKKSNYRGKTIKMLLNLNRARKTMTSSSKLVLTMKALVITVLEVRKSVW